MKTISVSILISVFGGGLLLGQEGSKASFDIGGGFTESVGSTRNVLTKTGWNVEVGAGYKLARHFGINIDVDYNSFGINNSTLSRFGAPGGNVDVFSATVDPTYHLAPFHHVNAYLIGGGGMFRQYQDFTAPGTATSGYGNSLFGNYPLGLGTQVLSSYSIIKPGYDVGAGFEVGTKFHGKFFAQAKYNHMFNTDSHTDFISSTVGFRF